MIVGFHSPLPPAPTGVADYAAALLLALRKLGEVEPGATNADVHLYQIGNNHLHRDIYARALRQPGIVVLHDAVLHHFFLGSLTEQEDSGNKVKSAGVRARNRPDELQPDIAHRRTRGRW
jgi:hypothetical protein